MTLALDNEVTGCTRRWMTSSGTGMHTAWWPGNVTALLAIAAANLLLHVLRIGHSMTDQGAAVIATFQLSRTFALAGRRLGVPAGPGGQLMATNAGDTDALLTTWMRQSTILIL